MSRRSVSRLARNRLTLFAALLVTAILINLIQFRSIDDNTSDHFAAIHRYDTGDITAIGLADSAPFRQMYGPYLALAEVAPGSTVLVLRGSRLTRYEFVSRVYGYGQVAAVERVSSDALTGLLSSHLIEAGTAGAATGAEGFDPTPFILARGDGGDRAPPWALAADPDPGPHPRQFVLLEWDQPRAGSEYEFQDLLLETSLLPADIRAEVTS